MQRILRLLNQLWCWLQRRFRRRSSSQRSSSKRRQTTTLSWVVPGKLAVGASPQPGDSALLEQAGIKVIFSLCAVSEGQLPSDVEKQFHCLRLVLPDSRYKSEIKSAQLKAAVEIIQHSVQSELPIYVHCLAGVERSPTVCIAYLCKQYNLELWEALNWIKQAHPAAMPQESQLKAVRHYLQDEMSESQMK